MFTFENHLQHGIDLLKQINQRIKPQLRNELTDSFGLVSENTVPARMNLAGIIEKYGPFPAYTTILGICSDGLPMILNLMHPAVGSFLILGDNPSGQSAFLQSVLQSGVRLNQPEQVSSVIISGDTETYSSLLRYKHCKRVIETSEHHAVYATLSELTGLLDKRRYHNSGGPAILLIIDELTHEMSDGSSKLSRMLYKLIKHGPRYHIWPFLSLPAQKIDQINPQFLNALRTYILGTTKADISIITGRAGSNPNLANLKEGKQFKINHNRRWIDLWLPESAGK